MASLKYLWAKRAKFSFLSVPFCKAWIKRLITLPELLKRNFRRYQLLLRGAYIDESSEIGIVKIDGNFQKLKIGSNSFLGKVYMALHDDIEIGSFVCINDGVQLLTGSHDISDSAWKHVKGKIIINDYAWVATNAIILPNVTIGFGAVIGAGAVVSKSIPDYAIVIGNPALILTKKRNTFLNYNPCEFLAANRAWLIG